ncbi:F-box domain-containing protein [Mycena sanguinolenta]|uniref:F-box domain-containing protein n=1 Tax=Mycena sanguinolenta TaxID=230812 RepID=A0A8H6Z729_9AGAR|nr:F-box domain-containing protein [Mycena sanguinolenta]
MSVVLPLNLEAPCSSGLQTRDYVSHIPAELLSTIFHFAQCPSAVDDRRSEEEDEDFARRCALHSQVAVLVSHVSGYWRAVALATCTLWRHIDIGRNESVEKIRAYLARSGPSTTLRFRLDLRWEIPALTEIVDLVFEHLDRWERFTIHSNIETMDIPVVSRLYDASAPALEQLGLCIHDIDSENLKRVRRADFEQILTRGCPRLTVVRLRGLSMHFFRPPLTSITTLYLEQTRGLFIGFECFKHLLTAAPALAHLSIHDAILDEHDFWPTDSVDSIPLPSLISLRIAIPGLVQHIFSDILISISAPKLQSLVLKDLGEFYLDRFLQLPGASSKFPALRALTFCDFDYQSHERLALMCAALPSITDFTCIHTTTDAPTLLFLMAGQSKASVAGSPTDDPWQRLRTFSTNLDVDDLELLRTAVERRQRIGFPLRVLRISGIDEEDIGEEEEETWKWLGEELTVDRFEALERWPPGSDFDPDDTLFT